MASIGSTITFQPELPSEEELTPGADGVIALSARNVRHIGRTYRDEQTGGTYFNAEVQRARLRQAGDADPKTPLAPRLAPSDPGTS